VAAGQRCSTFRARRRICRYIGSCVDILDVMRTQEENLAKQKLESVGTLASGIAHDFNNLLGGILAHSELALTDLPNGSRPEEELQRIRAAALRGAEIVQQLMIYAGQETEVLEPIDVSRIVEDMSSCSRSPCRNMRCWKPILARTSPRCEPLPENFGNL
jgi:C4-dicarboxylate-specific signal transduction histidine kinase